MRLANILTLLSFCALSLAEGEAKAESNSNGDEPVQIGMDGKPVPKEKPVLGIETIHAVECEQRTKNGDKIRIEFVGTLLDGKEWASTYKFGKPSSFRIGEGKVLKGLDQGTLDMCPGEKRKLTVPPEFGHGYNLPRGPIPGGSTLIIETELLEIVDETKEASTEEPKEEPKDEKQDEKKEEPKDEKKDEL